MRIFMPAVPNVSIMERDIGHLAVPVDLIFRFGVAAMICCAFDASGNLGHLMNAAVGLLRVLASVVPLHDEVLSSALRKF